MVTMDENLEYKELSKQYDMELDKLQKESDQIK